MNIKRCLVLLPLFLFAIMVMARDVTSFCDGWKFKCGPFPANAYKSTNIWNGKWEDVKIPHTWNAKDMQTQYNNFYQGVGYYRKNFMAPVSLKDKRVFLRFEGIGSCAEVYVNGSLVGSHKEPTLPLLSK